MQMHLRQSVRSLGNSPAFTGIAIFTLALGIGSATAVFSVLHSVALNPLPYRDSDRIVSITETTAKAPNQVFTSFATARDLLRRGTSLDQIAMWHDFGIGQVIGGHSVIGRGLRVNSGFFDVLGVRMHLGQAFTAEDDVPDPENKLIISYTSWLRDYGGRADIIGKIVPTGDDSWQIIGVLPPDFVPPHMSNPGEIPNVYAPMRIDECRSCRYVRLVARLKRGIAPTQAGAELSGIMRQLAHEYPGDYPTDASLSVSDFKNYMVGRLAPALWVLMGGVAALLLLACANVSSLLLARSTRRRTELAVRAALGAGRAKIVRLLLTESLLVSLAGGLFGTLLAFCLTSLIGHYGAREIPRIEEVRPSLLLLAAGIIFSILSAALFSLLPALQVTRLDLVEAIKGSSATTVGRSTHTFLGSLIAGELALAFVIVLSVGLLGKSYLQIMNVHAGFDPNNVMTLSLLPSWTRYATPESRVRYYERVAKQALTLPGIESAGFASTLPLSHPEVHRIYLQGHRFASPSEAPLLDAYYVSPGYFPAMKISLSRGRSIRESDTSSSAHIALISQSFARSLESDPIGQHLQIDSKEDKKPWFTIVGIVDDVRQYGLDSDPRPAVYLPFAQAENPQGWASLVVRSSHPLTSFEDVVRQALLAVDPAQPVFHLQPMTAYVSKSLASRILILQLISAFGVLALLLAIIGIYGVVSYTVEMRTRDIGICMALGAEPREITTIILRRTSLAAIAGLLIGLTIWLAESQFMSSLLFNLEPTDLTVLLSVATLMCIATLLSAYLPARRAATVDPSISLRSQ